MNPTRAVPNELEAQLRAAKPPASPPPGLHDAIMAAVRACPQSRAPKTSWARRFLVPSLAFAAALAATALWLWKPNPQADTLANPPGAATAQSAWALPARMPEVVLAPLTQELDAMRRDVQDAWEFLLATLP